MLQMFDGDQVYCKRLLEQFHLGDAVNKANESITIRVHLFNRDKFHVKIRRNTLLLIKSHFPSLVVEKTGVTDLSLFITKMIRNFKLYFNSKKVQI